MIVKLPNAPGLATIPVVRKKDGLPLPSTISVPVSVNTLGSVSSTTSPVSSPVNVELGVTPSLSKIRKEPCPSASNALVGFLILMKANSIPSISVSSLIVTVMVFSVSPGANVNVPGAKKKSWPSVADIPVAS